MGLNLPLWGQTCSYQRWDHRATIVALQELLSISELEVTRAASHRAEHEHFFSRNRPYEGPRMRLD